MECEKFDPLLIDELYDELDEVTSAAVKRHVAGCASCSSVLNGMKNTRRLVALPMVAVPVGLEDRILAAAREQQKVVPIQSRFSRTLSLAGKWAMKPQTAMAAVFLLMIGSSAFLIRNKKLGGSAPVSVEVQGRPDPVAMASAAPLDAKGASTSHGPSGYAYPPPAAAPIAFGDKDEAAKGKLDRSGSGDEKRAAANDDYAPSNAGALGGAPGDPSMQSAAITATKSANEAQQGPFNDGMSAYRARNYVEATRQFDAAAAGGDQNAALWAAKSVKDGNGGCAAAMKRFDAIVQKQPNTWLSNEAQLESARCLISQGQVADARNKLNALSKQASHQQQAQEMLKQLDEVAAGKSGGSAGGGNAAPRSGAAVAPKAAAPAPQKKALAKPAEQAPAADAQKGY